MRPSSIRRSLRCVPSCHHFSEEGAVSADVLKLKAALWGRCGQGDHRRVCSGRGEPGVVVERSFRAVRIHPWRLVFCVPCLHVKVVRSRRLSVGQRAIEVFVGPPRPASNRMDRHRRCRRRGRTSRRARETQARRQQRAPTNCRGSVRWFPPTPSLQTRQQLFRGQTDRLQTRFMFKLAYECLVPRWRWQTDVQLNRRSPKPS